MSQENTDGKKSIGICLSVISCVLSCIFSSLNVYPSQCSALRMRTCGATMIHIITTCGDDSNQKLKCTRQIIWRGLSAKERRDLHKVQLWMSGQECAVFAYSAGKKCLPIYCGPLGQNTQEWEVEKLKEMPFKSTKSCTNYKYVQHEGKFTRWMAPLLLWMLIQSQTPVIPWVFFHLVKHNQWDFRSLSEVL